MKVIDLMIALGDCDPNSEVHVEAGGDGAIHEARLVRVVNLPITHNVVLTGEPDDMTGDPKPVYVPEIHDPPRGFDDV